MVELTFFPSIIFTSNFWAIKILSKMSLEIKNPEIFKKENSVSRDPILLFKNQGLKNILNKISKV